MITNNPPSRASRRSLFPILGPLTALLFTLGLVQLLIAATDGDPGVLVGSTKTVSMQEATAGSELSYSIVVSYTGGTDGSIVVTDTLPTELTYMPNSLSVTNDIGTYGESGGVITWTGVLSPQTSVNIQFDAMLSESLTTGTVVTNSAVIDYLGNIVTPAVQTTIIDPTVHLPIFFKAPPVPELSATRPTSGNSWTLSWNPNTPNVTKYEIQEAQDSSFAGATTTELTQTSQQVTKSASFNNEYYYRVRSYIGDTHSDWSDVVKVVGNYRDDFNDPASDWSPVRRMTYLEETVARYGTGGEAGNLIIIVADRWDWMIASPLKEAPEPPYVIEYRARVHDASNLISGGLVVGGDWNGDPCPEVGNVYQTDNCFNQFYNFNFIFYGPIKVLHEQVDELAWCPNCMGSPLKRLGPTTEVDPIISNGPSLDWHVYRVEVEADGTRLYVDGKFIRHFPDTSYIDQPYFGVFASTDEYKPSIWFFDYFTVSHMD